MLTLRDAQGQLEACCEFWRVNPDGTRNEHGVYVWVHQIEVSEGVNLARVFYEIIRRIARSCPDAQGAYWQRAKTDEKPHFYTRTRLLQRRDAGCAVVA